LAGIVAMLAFLKANMASTSQRFLSVSIGKGNLSNTKEIFYMLFVMHLAIALLVLLSVDTVGLILVRDVLNIPPCKVDVACMVIHTMAITMAFTIMMVPYDAMLISRENIPALSFFLVLETLLNVVSITLVGFLHENRLMYYVTLLTLTTICTLILRILYTRRYLESRFKFHRIEDYSVIKSVSSYLGWSTVSSLFVLLRNQGYAFIFNIVGGVIVNSAYGIANQVNALVTYCVEALMQPIRPQIMKNESAGNQEKSIHITLFSTKCILFISTIVIVPLFVFINEVLRLWIADVPPHCASFCRILLIYAYIFCFSNGIKALIESGGEVKGLFVVPGFAHLVTIVVAIALAYFKVSVEIVFSMLILEEMVCCFYRIYLAKRQYDIGIKKYIYRIFIPCNIILLLSLGFTFAIHSYIPHIAIATISCIGGNMLWISITYFFCILNNKERENVHRMYIKAKKH